MGVDPFGYEDAARRVQVERVAADPSLQVAGAHGADLQEGGGERAFPQGGEGSHGVVAEDTVASWRSTSRAAASKERTPATVSRRTWCNMSSGSGSEPMITLPS